MFLTRDEEYGRFLLFRLKLDYDPKTGVVTNRKSGKTVGRKNDKGYVVISIRDKYEERSYTMMAARFAWYMVHGDIPEGYTIDHINEVRDDNRIENLQLYTMAQQSRKRDLKSNGYNLRRSGKYRACIKVNGKNKYLGQFDTAKEAEMAVRRARIGVTGL